MADDTEQKVGDRTFERVNELVAEGKNRSEAFTQVAEELNSKASTVAANFYRVARKHGQHGRQTPAKSAGRTRGQRRQGAKAQRRQQKRQPSKPVASSNGNSGEHTGLSELADRLVQTANEVAAAMREEVSMSQDMRERIERAESALRG